MISALAPLSLANRMNVFSKAFIPRSCARIRPICWSMQSTIAAWIAIFAIWNSRCSVAQFRPRQRPVDLAGPQLRIASGNA